MTTKEREDVVAFLSRFASISKELEEIILEHSGIKAIKKRTVVLQEGKIANECFFILQGCVKKYYLIDGEEKITNFYTEGQIITPASYTNREPSKYFLATVEETIALFGNPDTEKEATRKHPELESFIRVMTEKLMVDIADEFDNWVSHSAEDRYLWLLENRPDLVQRVPQYQIANYLGIKPESLSRIRKRLAK
ncbi:Crp/Fnr family transcriptional regulator [Lewinella sp. JB7]|uniref:Crp/Fnr family transcriptional regulator n=1 Tax=Lewinella sp. JB7 TaxID=2962887 RepID=UPI0020C95D77|nr:Crp/Fnr family transcriptional regulator [Lewinella sp. JB7]MCP9237531.1 Crp/Fnr family transcriptional regulator [Lewinella sp. JB7]